MTCGDVACAPSGPLASSIYVLHVLPSYSVYYSTPPYRHTAGAAGRAGAGSVGSGEIEMTVVAIVLIHVPCYAMIRSGVPFKRVIVCGGAGSTN
jgi:hypothetical protein